MNFLDLLVNPGRLIDPESKYLPKTQALLEHPFSRNADQTGAGKPGLQSFARNLFDANHGTVAGDWSNEHILGDTPIADQQAQADYKLRTSQPVQMTNTNPTMQQLIAQFMKNQGGG